MADSAVRWAPVASVALLVAVGLATTEQSGSVALAGAAVVLISVVLVRNAEDWVLTGGVLVAAAGATVIGYGAASNLVWFTMCVLVGWCAFRAGRTRAIAVGLVMVVGFVVLWVRSEPDGGWGGWIAGTLFSLVACLMAQRQSVLVVQLEAAQSALAERVVSQERTRIARELHDVIGHALTVSLLHVTSARLALREDPAEAERALVEAERLGRQGLVEVRHAVSTLRTDGQGRTPLPGADDLEGLVDSFRRSGCAITWDCGGDRSSLSAATGLTVYRILQEALTNVARHTPGAPTAARLVVAPATTELVVHSTVDGSLPGGQGSGVGVIGMRERAEAVGGTFTAGPEAGGWRVRAVLPT